MLLDLMAEAGLQPMMLREMHFRQMILVHTNRSIAVGYPAIGAQLQLDAATSSRPARHPQYQGFATGDAELQHHGTVTALPAQDRAARPAPPE
jgi:hypothetical protein